VSDRLEALMPFIEALDESELELLREYVDQRLMLLQSNMDTRSGA
jgi:hypothetical protein